jgi:ABC-2 type transport system permease protein
MSTLTYTVAHSATMLRRQLRHMWRYASMTLLLFVYVFGGTLGAGLGGPSGGGRAEYLEFVVPGILLIAVGPPAPRGRPSRWPRT